MSDETDELIITITANGEEVHRETIHANLETAASVDESANRHFDIAAGYARAGKRVEVRVTDPDPGGLPDAVWQFEPER